jgi:solute carrier family 25 carnitine/acylcarnitine transporter 20/29
MAPSLPKPAVPTAADVEAEAKAAAKSTLSGLRSFVAGGVGGLCAVVVGHPFDLIKVRMQTAEKGVYTGAIDVLRKTLAREGVARVTLHKRNKKHSLAPFSPIRGVHGI